MNDLMHILLGEDNTWTFLLECFLRSVAMFVAVLLLFAFTGKKEVRQFSTLELIVIIGLGSAVGDPMLHDDAPLLPAIVAITAVLLLYRLTNTLTNRSKRVGAFLEGEVATLFSEGRAHHEALKREGLSFLELVGDLRTKHVEHLGQVKAAHMEVDGELSVFFLPDDDVLYGLPIAPAELEAASHAQRVPDAPVSCSHCGFTVLHGIAPGACRHCGHTVWLRAINTKRVA